MSEVGSLQQHLKGIIRVNLAIGLGPINFVHCAPRHSFEITHA
jgi:hypothetical protein